MGASQPKQYLPLLGRPLIHHALATLCAAPDIDEVFVVLSVDDAEWARHDWAALGPKLVPLFNPSPGTCQSKPPARPERLLATACEPTAALPT